VIVLGSLRARLWLAILLASLVPLVALLFAGVLVAERGVEKADLQAMVRATRLLAEIFERWGTQTAAERQAIADAVASIDRKLYVVPAAETAFVINPRAAKRAQKGQETYGRVTKDGQTYLYAVVPTGKRAVIMLRSYGSPAYNWQAWTLTLGITAALAVIVAIAASWIASRSIVRPVRRVARASRELAEGDAPAPLPVSGPDELRSLAESFNEMAEELDEARASERAFLLSVTHELKTPVSAVRGYAEAQRDGVVRPEEAVAVIVAESGRLERLVQDLLDSARLSQHRFSVNVELVDLAEVAGAAVAGCEPQAHELGVQLDVEAQSPALALGDHDRVVQIVRNLIENALRCSPLSGVVRVVVEEGRIEVIDQGPGLTDEESRHAFERFYLYRRFRGERPVGTGLGLSIVKELAEAMGGYVRVSTTQGAGTSFSVHLPLPTQHPDRGHPIQGRRREAGSSTT
jgi:two-component system sensor histidine kinase BaeS